MELLDKRIAKTQKNLKGNKALANELDVLNKVNSFLGMGKSARAMDLDKDDAEFVRSLDLLSYKPVIYVVNVSEADAADGAKCEYAETVRKFAASESAETVVICADIEQQISELEPGEKTLFLDELGVAESGLDKLIKASYRLLDLISFLT